jgi:hypothetical protein
MLPLRQRSSPADLIIEADEGSLIVHRGHSWILKALVIGGQEVARGGKLVRIKLDAVERELDAHVLSGASGRDEEVLLADGVIFGQLAALVIDGFATVRATLVPLNGREKPVVWMKITDAGQKAIAE